MLVCGGMIVLDKQFDTALLAAEGREAGVPALFLGIGTGGIFHYRQFLPALAVGADVASWDDEQKQFLMRAAAVHEDPKVCVFQMPVSNDHFKIMRGMREQGLKVVANVDDYVMNIRKQSDHHFTAHHFTKSIVEQHQKCLRFADALIVSTQWLADRLRKFNPNVYICRNGIDSGRYLMHEGSIDKDDENVLIGWAGGTGHKKAMHPISGALKNVLWDNPESVLMFIGEDFRYLFEGVDASIRDRVAVIGWEDDLYTYPRKLAAQDIGLAPSDESHFYKGKSQLRLYESGVLGVPMVVGPRYTEIQHGVTGFMAKDSADWEKYLGELIRNESLRTDMGLDMQNWVLENATIEARAQSWMDALEDIING
jgi:glycosyltransferase involved in cell wall biosynthesis